MRPVVARWRCSVPNSATWRHTNMVMIEIAIKLFTYEHGYDIDRYQTVYYRHFSRVLSWKWFLPSIRQNRLSFLLSLGLDISLHLSSH